MEEIKKCKTYGEAKPLSLMGKNSNSCKACRAAYHKKWAQANPEKVAIAKKKDWDKNREKILARNNANYHRNWEVRRRQTVEYRQREASRRMSTARIMKHRRRYPERDIARKAITKVIRSGQITRQPCEVCNNPKSQAHHDDYSKPLEVRWLCFKHHRQVHGQQHFFEEVA